MGKVVRCAECAKVYRDPEELEELRDNDSVCMVCNAPIEVSSWDRILASWDDEEDLDDLDDDLDEDWSDDGGDRAFDDDVDEDEVDDELAMGFDDGDDEEESDEEGADEEADDREVV